MADARSTRSGRTNALDEARELVSLLGSLSEEGDEISVSTIAARLGVSDAQARRLIDLLVSSGSQTQEYLPLASDDDDEDTLVLVSHSGVRGRPLRLSMQESIAVQAALNTIGVPADDPIRSKLSAGLSSSDIDETWIRQALATADDTVAESLSVCVQALLQGGCMTFFYLGSEDTSYRKRSVRPSSIDHMRSHWYCDAFDLDRMAQRTFRIDRMRDARTLSMAESSDYETAIARAGERIADTRDQSQQRTINLEFFDSRYLELFEWPGLHVMSREDTRITARITYYVEHPTWLVRHIAACGGKVRTSDERITSLVAQYAETGLSSG